MIETQHDSFHVNKTGKHLSGLALGKPSTWTISKFLMTVSEQLTTLFIDMTQLVSSKSTILNSNLVSNSLYRFSQSNKNLKNTQIFYINT